jgi:hypothetical protein
MQEKTIVKLYSSMQRTRRFFDMLALDTMVSTSSGRTRTTDRRRIKRGQGSLYKRWNNWFRRRGDDIMDVSI